MMDSRSYQTWQETIGPMIGIVILMGILMLPIIMSG
jgi:hypothetical protein